MYSISFYVIGYLKFQMGHWAKSLFGVESYEDVGLVLAGKTRKHHEEEVVGFFDKELSFKDRVYHAHLVSKNGKNYPLVFNVYGAPAMVDVLAEMHDGGCRTVLFIGYAYGGFKQNLPLGTVVLPSRAYHFEGIYHPIEPDRKYAEPDAELYKKVEEVFNKNNLVYVIGRDISVPAVKFQLPHANEEYEKIDPTTVEMELASCLSRAHDMGIRAVGILVISDNRDSAISDETKRVQRHKAKSLVVKTLVENLDLLSLPHLPMDKPFEIDTYLADVIRYPEAGDKNIYRDR